MTLTPVSSSQINSMGHFEGNRMQVQFKSGATYEYSNVPKELFDSLLTAESVGSAFAATIKKHPDLYPYSKL